MSMVEAKFHLFQIQEKVIAPDPIIAPQLCFGERPKTLDAVDVVPLSREFTPSVINPVMPVAIREKAVIGSERIGVDRASLGNLLFDNKAEHGPRDIGNRARVNLTVPLKKSENSDFSGGTSTTAVAFAAAAEVGLVNFDLSGQGSFTLAFSDDGIADEVIDTLRAVSVDAKLASGANRRNLEGE